eukprot:95496-Hanusia_phi.AAC.1
MSPALGATTSGLDELVVRVLLQSPPWMPQLPEPALDVACTTYWAVLGGLKPATASFSPGWRVPPQASCCPFLER